MRKFNLSANIENGWDDNIQYVVTPNAKRAVANIFDGFHSGIHSFTIVGTYGTGKSSFLLALERDLMSKNKQLLGNSNVLVSFKDFEILNIVGDYEDLTLLMARKLGVECTQVNVLDALRDYYNKCKSQGEFLLIVVDEFGKILEHAAEKNPEKELYFLQKLAEFINVTSRNAMLLTTLHQNFSAYAKRLTESQKDEWTKVKGRFQEIVFVEPIEQILILASEQLESKRTVKDENVLRKLYSLAIDSNFISDSLTYEAMKQLYPLDPLSAFALTKAIQRYGQNERSLFTFLSIKGNNSFGEYEPQENLTYNLQVVYDYIKRNFYSYLQDANADSMTWSGMHTAIERVEGQNWDSEEEYLNAIKLVKAIGMLNLFGTASFKMDINQTVTYAESAMNVENASSIIRKLVSMKIIRYAEYKNRLVLFEGTDVDIEGELAKATLAVPKPINFVDDLRFFFAKRISPVKACYYHRGTPRYFNYLLSGEPVEITPKDDTDGYVELIFPTNKGAKDDVIRFSSSCDKALIFVIFKDTKEIVDHLYNINKYDYLLQRVLIDKMDQVAIREVNNLKLFEAELLNETINEGWFSFEDDVEWIYKGRKQTVKSQKDFNQLLSVVCEDVYPKTPIMNNELFNRHKLSSSISAAKAKYLDALVENSEKADLGFSKDKFPPEKTIYYSLLRNTRLHNDGGFSDIPSKGIQTLWDACESFLASTTEKARKISELQYILAAQPYKIKQGFLDFWIPTYLFMKRQDYSLYDVSTGAYIPNVNRAFFDLLQKHPSDYAIKAFNVSGVQLDFYNQYRKFINLGNANEIKGDKFIETIKPFLFFYRRLNDYAKHTRKFDSETTLRFRDVLSNAKDPEKTFFEDIPEALGYDRNSLGKDDFVKEYCDKIQLAVRDLRTCYDRLIDRIEERIVEALSLSSCEYSNYIVEIRQRYGAVKTYLLTDKQREFHAHVMTIFDNRKEWYQSICYTAMGQSLEHLRDEQEEQLEDNLIFLFRECEKYSRLSEMLTTDSKDEGFSFDIASNDGNGMKSQAFLLPQKDKAQSESLEKSIDAILSDNDNVNICTLLRIIKKRMEQ